MIFINVFFDNGSRFFTEKETLFSALKESVMDALSIPERDIFIRLMESVSPSKDILTVELTLPSGMQKENLFPFITRNLTEKLNMRMKDLYLILQEKPLSHFGAGAKNTI